MDSEKVMRRKLTQPTEEVIYSKKHRFLIKSTRRSDQVKNLTLSVLISKVVGLTQEKCVAVKITDDDDVFLYYYIILTPSIFWKIKRQHALILEYSKLAHLLIELFESCSQAVSCPRYDLVLEESTAGLLGICKITINVMETTQFKQMCHLSLEINPGRENEVKRHLALQFSLLKETLSEVQGRANQGELYLQEVVRKLDTKTEELEDIQVHWREECNHHQQQLAAERDNFMKTQFNLKNSFESDKKSFDEALGNLQTENKRLYKEICELHTKLRETTEKLSNAQNESNALRINKEKIYTEACKVDAEYHEKKKAVHNLETEVAVHHQEIRDKDILLDQQRKFLHVVHEQKVDLKYNLAKKDEILQKKQTSLSALSRDLCKANEIIWTLNKEMLDLKNELKCTKESISKQGHYISSKNKELMELKVKVEENCTIISKQEYDLSSKEKEVVELKAKMNENDEIINALELSEQKLQQKLEAAKKALKKKDIALSKKNKLISWLACRNSEFQKSSAKETSKAEKLPSSVVTRTSTPQSASCVRTRKRMFVTTRSSRDNFISNSENSVNQKTDATTSQPLVLTTQSAHFLASYHAFIEKRACESHEEEGSSQILYSSS